MFDNVALNVFIGLIFVYLLYSLLATIIMEFIAHFLSMRPRLLVKALRRMLEDNPKAIFGEKKRWTAMDLVTDTIEAVKRFFYPFRNLPFLQRFYYHPTVKYLAESKSSSKPSYMRAENFSQTIIQLFRGESYAITDNQILFIEKFLFVEAVDILKLYKRYEHWILNWHLLIQILGKDPADTQTLIKMLERKKQNIFLYNSRKVEIEQLIVQLKDMSIGDIKEFMKELKKHNAYLGKKISAETLEHFQNLFKDAQYDLVKFRIGLETWYSETMERATGWYKRQTQIILLVLGFVVAVMANVDSILIYKVLAKDKSIRDQFVQMATANYGQYAPFIDTLKDQRNAGDTLKQHTTANSETRRTINDTLLKDTYKILQEDKNTAGSIMGLGWCTTDSCIAYQNKLNSLKLQEQQLEKLKKKYASDSLYKADSVKLNQSIALAKAGYIMHKNPWNGWSVVGWLITALAISLGAPFWFDILNKIMKLRGTGNKIFEPTLNDQSNTETQPLSIQVKNNSGDVNS